MKNLEILQQAGKNDLLSFSIGTHPKYAPNWHHEEVANLLHAVEKGEEKRVMIFMPPRSGKSQLATINFPAWFLGRNPDREIIVISYSGELAADFGAKTRDLVSSPAYKIIFPNVRLKEDEKSKGHWRTTQGGSYISVGVGGAVTGRGADILILDDPIKNAEEAESLVYRKKVWDFYVSTARTRLNPDAKIIVILTRWHADDIAARLLESAGDGGEQWKVLSFPAIAIEDEEHRKEGEALWPERYSLEDLQSTKNTIGTYNWNALYQQNPIVSENQEFRQEWFLRRTQEDIQGMRTRNFLTIDTAVSKSESADYSAFISNFVDREGKWNIRAEHSRLSPTELIDRIFYLHGQHHYESVGIEKGTFQMAIKPFFDEEMRKRNVYIKVVELEHHQTAKETRIRGLIPRYENGGIFHVDDCLDLEEELLSFPRGKHDDLCDSLAYQLQMAKGSPVINLGPWLKYDQEYKANRKYYYPDLGI